MLFGCLVLLGWIFDITALKTFLLGAFSVKANAAVGFLLAGVSLRLALIDPTDRRIQSLKQACAVVVALIGLLTLSQYLFGWNLGIDQLLFKEPVGAFGTFSPGRMGPNTALNFLLVGIGLLLMDRETRQGRHPAQYLIISACVIAVLAVVGHFYGAKVLFGILDYTLMPVQTGAAFTVLCLSMLFAQSEIGLMAIINNSGNAGLLTLRMLPIALIVPVVLGWIGLMGERAGLYDTTFGISLMAVTYTIVLVIGILVTARSLNQTDATRREIENGLENTRKELEIIKITADEVSEFAESVINTVREPLISLDQDLRVVSSSRSFYEFFKVNPEETVGQLIYDLGNKQWDIPKLRELLETILPEKASFDNYEVEHDFATIGRRTMLLNARQIQRMQGKERIILLAIEDITERREVEIGLEKTHEELNELATELNRASRAKSEFLANMSHELRTPLNSIIGFSEVLYDETFGSINEKQRKYVNNVLTSGKHLLLLINQILDTAKVESGMMKLALSSLPMKDLLNEISMLVTDLVSKKKLQLLLEIDEDLPSIEGDELKVKEIIYNLLSNAVKFTPEGGTIGLRAKNTGSGVEIVVWDTGIGIAAENIEKVFEGFFRVDTPYSRLTEGTGLGLPLSRKLAELHGGKLSVESEGLNKGTLVRLTLPLLSRKEG